MKGFKLIRGLMLVLIVLTSGLVSAQEEQPTGVLAYYSSDASCVVVYSFETKETSDCVAKHSFDPDWNSDGTKLALTVGINPDGYNIAIWDEATGELSQVTFGAHVYNLPAWSPDGEWIAFMAVEEVSKEPWVTQRRGVGLTSLKVLRVTDGEIFTLVEAHPGGRYTADMQPVDTISYTPSWSPDGQWIAYTGEAYAPVDGGSSWVPTEHILGVSPNVDDPIRGYLMSVLPSDSLAKESTTPAFIMPAWSPDGGYIALVAYGNSGIYDTPDLYLMQAETSVDFMPRLTRGAWATNPDWSPDGKWLTYSGQGGVYIVKADGSQEPVYIAEGSDPSWGQGF